MITQEWVMCNGKRLCVVTNIETKIKYRKCIVFLPGFSQTKAGSYFLFTQICNSLAENIATIQFDYRGFGDSEGESEEVDLKTMYQDAREITKWIYRKNICETYTYIGHGVGNYLAAILASEMYGADAILVAPQPDPLKSIVKFNSIVQAVEDFKGDTVDTGDLCKWDENTDEFFAILGGRLNRSKGIVVKRDFLIQAINFNLSSFCIENIKINILDENENFKDSSIKLIGFGIKDSLLLDMLEREKVIKKICDMCM